MRSGATELDRDNGSCSLTQGELSQDVFLSDPGRVGGEEGERLVSYEVFRNCLDIARGSANDVQWEPSIYNCMGHDQVSRLTGFMGGFVL